MRARTLGAVLGLGTAFLALRPAGTFDRLVGTLMLPARLVAPLGVASVWIGSDAGSDGGSEGAGGGPDSQAGTPEGAQSALEAELSLRLERAVLRSAWPVEAAIPRRVIAIPGEVDVRKGVRRDHITVRVADATPIRVDHPVVAGDVYVGRVERIPFRQPAADRPGFLERLLRRVGLGSPPRPAPRNVVEVALITGAEERVGALIPRDQDGRPCHLVAGGLSPRRDRVWLAVHNPESRATRSGRVLVKEPFGRVNGFDSLAEGFVLGELREEPYQREGETFERDILGIAPSVDFESGLNQVLVLTDTMDVTAEGRSIQLPVNRESAGALASAVRETERWLPVRRLASGDTSPWRSSMRIDLGRRSGLIPGAAVVRGVRLVGRVARCDAAGATVALLEDTGFTVDVLAQAVLDPDGPPLVLGRVRVVGRTWDRLDVDWNPGGSARFAEWCASHSSADKGAPPAVDAGFDAGSDAGVDAEVDPRADAEEEPGDAAGIPVRLWTGSGMEGTPRGLLLGTTTLPLAAESDVVRLLITDFGGGPDGGSGGLHVWAGSLRGRSLP